MTVKAILIPVTALLALGSAGVWFVIAEKHDAQECRERFFGTTKEFPTSGGQKMKPEW